MTQVLRAQIRDIFNFSNRLKNFRTLPESKQGRKLAFYLLLPAQQSDIERKTRINFKKDKLSGIYLSEGGGAYDALFASLPDFGADV